MMTTEPSSSQGRDLIVVPNVPDNDPMGDAERGRQEGTARNFARTGSARASSLLYTFGPGSIMDLPNFTVMPSGLAAYDRIWSRRPDTPTVDAPRLLEVVQMFQPTVKEFRPFPWQPKINPFSGEGTDLGIPARVFPQWLRCTGCDMLAPLSLFQYSNVIQRRPDEASFQHERCPGRRGDASNGGAANTGRSRSARRSPAVPARFVLMCPNGHLDEFPYAWWVHDGGPCPQAEIPKLRMTMGTGGKGGNAQIHCVSCKTSKNMAQAQGESGRKTLPKCRGRHVHLDGFEPEGCDLEVQLTSVGASNLWFPVTQSIVVIPRSEAEHKRDVASQIRFAFTPEEIGKLLSYPLEAARDLVDARLNPSGDAPLGLADDQLVEALQHALQEPESVESRAHRRASFDPVDLLVPEWNHLQLDPRREHDPDERSGLVLDARQAPDDVPFVNRVLAVERLRKVNTLLGFTRIDAFDRANDIEHRLVSLTSLRYPSWALATEDRGEGIFLQLDESMVAQWEARVEASSLWRAHREAHDRNFRNRFSETAASVEPETRLPPPRYWLVHTLSHILMREMAMYAGYGAASISERLYAWKGDDGRPPAAGVLIATTASDSDGTLGGLVRLSEKHLLGHVLTNALRNALRCSSDPVCARRTPKDPEDFLHGAACHCCAMASETSCERSNRFLDRRFLVTLPESDLAFFGDPRSWT